MRVIESIIRGQQVPRRTCDRTPHFYSSCHGIAPVPSAIAGYLFGGLEGIEGPKWFHWELMSSALESV